MRQVGHGVDGIGMARHGKAMRSRPGIAMIVGHVSSGLAWPGLVRQARRCPSPMAALGKAAHGRHGSPAPSRVPLRAARFGKAEQARHRDPGGVSSRPARQAWKRWSRLGAPFQAACGTAGEALSGANGRTRQGCSRQAHQRRLGMVSRGPAGVVSQRSERVCRAVLGRRGTASLGGSGAAWRGRHRYARQCIAALGMAKFSRCGNGTNASQGSVRSSSDAHGRRGTVRSGAIRCCKQWLGQARFNMAWRRRHRLVWPDIPVRASVSLDLLRIGAAQRSMAWQARSVVAHQRWPRWLRQGIAGTGWQGPPRREQRARAAHGPAGRARHGPPRFDGHGSARHGTAGDAQCCRPWWSRALRITAGTESPASVSRGAVRAGAARPALLGEARQYRARHGFHGE